MPTRIRNRSSSLPPIRILIFHGYLLSGTGSNVYNASLARALRSLGHEVHLLCQEGAAGELDWVDRVGDWDSGELRVRDTGAAPGAGSVAVYKPDIAGLLPVFVRDRYAGFTVKTFLELSDAELDRYLARNVAAVREVVERVGPPDAGLANHLVMSPVILARVGVQYALKVHGSDLSYTVLPALERFGPYAREALEGAAGVLVGSTHIAERLRQAVDDPGANAKVRLGPPGADTGLFTLIGLEEAGTRLRELAAELREAAPGAPLTVPDSDAWTRDPDEAATAIEWLAEAEGPRVVFVGKLIVTKGVDLLLAAWPLVHAVNPRARLLIAGFGAFRDGLEQLAGALAAGDLDAAQSLARRGRELEGGPAQPLRRLGAFLADPPPGYAESAARAGGSVAFAGRLEYDEVGALVPACQALVFPSTFPEAFGMVAAEAAAAGVLPVSAAHSGALEVSRTLAAGLPAEAAGLVSFTLDAGAVAAIAERLNAWFELAPEAREHCRRALRETAVRHWAWERVARDVIAASAGHLDELRAVARSA